jgi:hypothetical protein
MKLPIIVSEHGDITVFADWESAEQYLEPQDVRNSEYQIFDAAGDLLRIEVRDVPAKGILGKVGVRLPTVEISEPRVVQNHRGRLCDLLAQFLARTNSKFDQKQAFSLLDLIISVRELKR